jgi:hypothetical protein
MVDYHEKTTGRGDGRRDEAAAAEELLLEQSVGELRPPPGSAGPSLLRPQQHRNAVWRWQIRRRNRP